MAAAKEQLAVATLDDILAADDIGKPETVAVPAWKRSVRVRGLSRGEVKACIEMEDRQVGYLHFGLVEPAVTLEQAATLDTKSFAAVQVILERIIDLSGLGAGFRQGETGGAG